MKTKNKPIESLSPEQELRLKAVYLEWLDIGRSVEPINKEAAVKVVTEMYRRIGKPAPAIFVFSSPMMCILAWGVLRTILDKTQLMSPLGDQQLWDRLNEPLWDCLMRDLMGPLGVQLRKQLREQLKDQLSGRIWNQLMCPLNGRLGQPLIRQLWNQLMGPPNDQFREQVMDQLDGQLWTKIWQQLAGPPGGPPGGPLRNQFSGQLQEQLCTKLWNQLGGPPEGPLMSELSGQLEDQLWNQLSNHFGGQHSAACQVFYKFCEEIGCQYTAKSTALLNLWMDEGRALHWWFPYEGIVLLSERHTRLHLDDRGRLHCENDIACGYSDGWGIHAWHGTQVPEWIIHRPEIITLGVITREPNAEIRRVMVERYGLDRLKDQGTLIHQEKLRGNFPQYMDTGGKKEFLGYVAGEETVGLYELPVENAEGRRAKVIHVICPSTGRDYVLGVDAEHTNAIEAVASTFGLTEREYREAVYAHS